MEPAEVTQKKDRQISENYQLMHRNKMSYVHASAIQIQAHQSMLLNLHFNMSFVLNLTGCFMSYRAELCIMSNNFHVDIAIN